MKLKLRNPLVVFDLESTGTNVSTDRIVEFAMIKILPTGETLEKQSRINPTIPIPLETSLIHGIYTNDVAESPTFKQIAKELIRFIEGCDLAGFNCLKFDIPLLAEEFLRAGVDFDVDSRHILDVQKIFHLMEKRNLTAAYKFYCQKNLENAHNAMADTSATYEVLLAQVDKYEGETVTDLLGQKIGVFTSDISDIHRITNERMVDLAGRMVFNEKGEEVFNFGKHKGKPVSEVLSAEPSFYDWMMRGDFALETKRKLTQIRLRNARMKS